MKENTVGLIYVQTWLIMKGYFNCVSRGWTSFCWIQSGSPESCSVTKRSCLGRELPVSTSLRPRAFPHSCRQAGASSRCGSSPDGLFPGELPLADRATWLLDRNPQSNDQGTKNSPWVRAEARLLARLSSPAHLHFLQGSSLTTRSQERPSCYEHTKSLSCYWKRL